jgi:heme-degrading monooxygenase HmoA
MFVTIATFQETGEQLEEGMRHVREEVVPSIRGAKGVRAAYWMVDKGNGKRLSVTVWDDADAVGAAMPGVMASIKRLRDESGRMEPQRSPDHTERFEVFAQV